MADEHEGRADQGAPQADPAPESRRPAAGRLAAGWLWRALAAILLAAVIPWALWLLTRDSDVPIVVHVNAIAAEPRAWGFLAGFWIGGWLAVVAAAVGDLVLRLLLSLQLWAQQDVATAGKGGEAADKVPFLQWLNQPAAPMGSTTILALLGEHVLLVIVGAVVGVLVRWGFDRLVPASD